MLDDEEASVNPQAIINMGYFHPFGASLLPTLRSLTWRASNDAYVIPILPFLSPSLQNLTVWLRTFVSEVQASRLFGLLKHRTPCLTTFDLGTNCAVSDVSDTLSSWLVWVPTLQNVSLPRYYYAPKIVTELGRLPNLKFLSTSYYFYQDPTSEGTQYNLQEGTFPRLNAVDIEGTLLSLSKLLNPPNSFSQLSGLGVDCASCTNPLELQRLLVLLVASCPSLDEVALNLFSHEDWREEEVKPLSFSDIRPLLSCHRLEKVEIGHDHPLVMEKADVQAIGEAWKGLREFRVCEDPRRGDNGELPKIGNTISLLRDFAIHCPHLIVLGLYLNDEKPSFDGNLNPTVQFRSIQEFQFGTSPIPGDDVYEVAFFLASVCLQTSAGACRSGTL